MTARGVEYLNEWVGENVPPLPVTGDVLIRALELLNYGTVHLIILLLLIGSG